MSSLKRLLLISLISTYWMLTSARAEEVVPELQKETHTQWIEKSLKKIQSIHIGMARNELSQLFMTEGGISNRYQRTYVYKECPYIKLDVGFQAIGNEKDVLGESAEDVILKISGPYLDWSIMD